MRLVDRRFSGIARGVGTAKILGRVHSAPMKVADLHLPCSFTIMEGRDVDLLFGLDMLKAHQACIDLEKNALRIQGREVQFLAEHELPDKARIFEAGAVEEADAEASQPSGSQPQQHFPGAGNTLGAAPAPAPVASATAAASQFPEESIKILMDLGVTREAAIATLEASGGNVDVAASMLF